MYNQSLDIKKGFNLHSISALLTSWLITDKVCPAEEEKLFWEEPQVPFPYIGGKREQNLKFKI